MEENTLTRSIDGIFGGLIGKFLSRDVSSLVSVAVVTNVAIYRNIFLGREKESNKGGDGS